MLCRRDILRSCARKMSDLFLLQIRLRSCMNFFGFNLQLLQNFLRSCRTFCALSGFSSYGMDFGLFFAASHFLVRIRICSEVRIRISKTFFSWQAKPRAPNKPHLGATSQHLLRDTTPLRCGTGVHLEPVWWCVFTIVACRPGRQRLLPWGGQPRAVS